MRPAVVRQKIVSGMMHWERYSKSRRFCRVISLVMCMLHIMPLICLGCILKEKSGLGFTYNILFKLPIIAGR